MSMGSSAHSCKISMLWNWYTVDTCFIALSWHVRSKGGFAGSCIGVFFLVMSAQWLHRVAREYDLALIAKTSSDPVCSPSSSQTLRTQLPLIAAFSHQWLIRSNPSLSVVEHLTRTVLYTLEWGLSYMIMLLFMYYNGYIIISCILGALVGRFLFTYSEPLNSSCIAESEELDRKCCR